MDARAARPRSGPVAVRLSDPGELASAVPHLLGFRPAESVVLLSLVGERGSRLGLTVRADIPPAEHGIATARQLAAKVLSDRPSGVVAVVVSEAPDGADGLPHRGLLRDVVVALAGHAVPMAEALLVRGGRWWSYDCPGRCCSPGAGTPLPGGVSELEVAAVASGVVVERDRDALAGRIARPGAQARQAMAEACAQVAVACADGIVERGWDVVAEESWTAVLGALARSRPGPPTASAPLTDREVARLLWGLRDRAVRDRALELALGPDAVAAEQLWTVCTGRAPVPLDAAPATLLAVSAWLRGDGAMADVALSRALAGSPDYTLARLLAQALDACVRPAELRALIRRAAAGGAA
ncbi:MAG TPA: DUF4192 domain-containing protein [Blastococcus sp.]|jgi:hypothetical protein|nr:DUF4192 domain-containing protein [Blastococcus sp.]